MLLDITQAALAKALDGTATRNRFLANNIANVETPNFHRRDVAFEDALRQALHPDDASAMDASFDSHDAAQVQSTPLETINDTAQPERDNGNNVDPDKEMARLADNTLRYEAILQTMTMKNSMLLTAIHEGRR